MKLNSIMLIALFAGIAAAQSDVHTFIQGPTEVKISSVPIFANGEAVGFNQMVCARSYDAGVADLRIKGEITLADFQAIRFKQGGRLTPRKQKSRPEERLLVILRTLTLRK